MYKNYFFDLDGTLVDSSAGIQFSIEQALAACGRPTDCDVRPHIGPPIRKIFTALLGPDIPDMEALVVAYRSSYDNDGWKRTVLMPGAMKVLGALRDNPLFLVTNKPQAPTMNILRKFRIENCFWFAASPDYFRPSAASKAEIIKRLMRLCCLKPPESLLVGDTLEDYESAKENGLEAAILSSGANIPCRRIKHLEEILND